MTSRGSAEAEVGTRRGARLSSSSRRSGAGRLVGVDATRGLALLGMMAVHIYPGRELDGSVSLAEQIAGGRSAATFAVLAGVGLALASGGPRPPTGRRWAGFGAATAVRAVAIGAIGLALGYPDSGVAVILPYYAVLFLLAIPLLPLRTPALGWIGVGVAVIIPPLSQAARANLGPPDYGNPTFATLLEAPRALLQTLLVTGYYPVLAWSAYVVAGLAAGRLRLTRSRTAWGLLAVGSALAVAAVAVSSVLLGPLGGRSALASSLGVTPRELTRQTAAGFFYGTTPPGSWWWLAVDNAHSGTTLDLVHTTGVALALLGAMLLLARVVWPLLVPLAAAGGMTLTLYSTHVLLLGSGWLPPDPTTSYLVQVVLFLAGATLWRTFVGRGPLEAAIAAVATPVRRAVAG
jgi:uncharacterized membrane protein